jgi:hypothetical protein
MRISILNAMIVDFMTRRLLQRRIYRLFIQRMPNEHVLNRSRIDLVVLRWHVPGDNRKLNRFKIESDEQCEQWLLPETIAIGSRSIQSEHKAVSN